MYYEGMEEKPAVHKRKGWTPQQYDFPILRRRWKRPFDFPILYEVASGSVVFGYLVERGRIERTGYLPPAFVIYAFARDVVTGGPEGRSVVKVFLHHTNCGLSGCYHHAPGLLSKHMGVAESALEKLEVSCVSTQHPVEV